MSKIIKKVINVGDVKITIESGKQYTNKQYKSILKDALGSDDLMDCICSKVWMWKSDEKVCKEVEVNVHSTNGDIQYINVDNHIFTEESFSHALNTDKPVRVYFKRHTNLLFAGILPDSMLIAIDVDKERCMQKVRNYFGI